MQVLLSLAIVLAFALPVLSADDPETAAKKIKEMAAARYADDFEMQEFTVKNQLKAYRAVQDLSAAPG